MNLLNKFLCFLRNKAFWTLDSLKGGHLKSSYEDIKRIYYSDSTSVEVREYQQRALQKLFRHAHTTTKHYKQVEDFEDLNSYQIITKETIRGNLADFLSTKFNKDDLHTMSTSGSTGTPFLSYQDTLKRKRVQAEVIFFSELVGYRVGYPLIFLRALVPGVKKSRIKQWMQNEELIDISSLKDVDIERVLKRIEAIKANEPVLLAYASTYDALREYMTKSPPPLKKSERWPRKGGIKGIISGAEILYPETREPMEEYFNTKAYSRYSNQENGILAQDEHQPNTFIINEASYLIEIFDLEEDATVPEGTMGRIIITDLFNFAMPMVRYDTGDVGILKTIEINGFKKKVLLEIGGRKVDVIYNTQGERLSPHFVTNTLWKYPEINQFQFVQKGKAKYILNVKMEKEFNQEEKLMKDFKLLLGDDAEFKVCYVPEIPLLPSGKRRYIINEYTNK